MILYILNYNNYYNRIIKRESSLSDYIDNYLVYSLNATNFNPNDGIATEHIIGQGDYDGKGDYLLAVENNEIVSRWFIIESVRTRAGQYKLQLYRDTIADFYDNVMESTAFIEKASCNADSPFIYNEEDMTVNQIKTHETLLMDETESAWVVGYYSRNIPNENLKGNIPINPLNDTYDILLDKPFNTWEYNATQNPYLGIPKELEYRIYMKATEPYLWMTITNHKGPYCFGRDGTYIGSEEIDGTYALSWHGTTVALEGLPVFSESIKAADTVLYSQLGGYTDIPKEDDINYFLNLNGKVIKDSTGAYYQIAVNADGIEEKLVNISAGNMFESFNAIVKNNPYVQGTADAGSFKVLVKYPKYTMVASELSGLSASFDMSATKLITEDAPYNIFAIPYGDVELRLYDATKVVSSKEVALKAAEAIVNKMGAGETAYLYDIQLLPYCPLGTTFKKGVTVKTEEAYSLIVDSEDNPISFILNVPNSQFSKNISRYIDCPANPIDKKIKNQCVKHRLCSPNYNSYFDFSVAKNGTIHHFNVDCTYKPFQPYIHLNPDFGDLYGDDFNDPRGLICGGDFALTQVSDAWINYQIQNKNFQEIFDREIENLELKNRLGRTTDIANAVAGTISGAVSGAAAGGIYTGGTPVGMAVGAVAGGVSSAIGGAADVQINQKLRNEAIDYTRDNFGYKLGNIQALPNTLTKVSSLTPNNKIFPVLETYECTEEEKDALANKIAYNGMTIMAIDTVKKYATRSWIFYSLSNGRLLANPNYIKCQLIKLPQSEAAEDFHLANTIAGELNKGVFMQ